MKHITSAKTGDWCSCCGVHH